MHSNGNVADIFMFIHMLGASSPQTRFFRQILRRLNKYSHDMGYHWCMNLCPIVESFQFVSSNWMHQG